MTSLEMGEIMNGGHNVVWASSPVVLTVVHPRSAAHVDVKANATRRCLTSTPSAHPIYCLEMVNGLYTRLECNRYCVPY